jgi:hypothetical protein
MILTTIIMIAKVKKEVLVLLHLRILSKHIVLVQKTYQWEMLTSWYLSLYLIITERWRCNRLDAFLRSLTQTPSKRQSLKTMYLTQP